MRQQAVEQIGREYANCLHLGEFLKCEAPAGRGSLEPGLLERRFRAYPAR